MDACSIFTSLAIWIIGYCWVDLCFISICIVTICLLIVFNLAFNFLSAIHSTVIVYVMGVKFIA